MKPLRPLGEMVWGVGDESKSIEDLQKLRAANKAPSRAGTQSPRHQRSKSTKPPLPSGERVWGEGDESEDIEESEKWRSGHQGINRAGNPAPRKPAGSDEAPSPFRGEGSG